MRRQPVLGVTKCPECRHPLEGHEVFVRVVEEFPWRTSSSGHMYRSLTPVKVQQRWHQSCWDRIAYDLEHGRLRSEVERAEELIVLADGISHERQQEIWMRVDAARAALREFETVPRP